MILLFLWSNTESFTEIIDEVSTLKTVFNEEIIKMNYEDKIILIINLFNKTLREEQNNLANRLPSFKKSISSMISDNKLVENLYFDLRMNEKIETQKKFITSYLFLSDIYATKKIKNIQLDDKNLTMLLEHAKEWAKKASE